VTSLAFAPGGATLASGSLDDTAVIWDLAKHQALARLTGQEHGVSSVLWLDGGTRLATAAGDGVIRLWDVERREVAITLRGHSAEVASLAVSPAGDRLYSCSTSEQRIKVWDPRRDPTGLRMTTLAVNVRLAFTPDGQRLVSAAGNPSATDAPGELVVWHAETGHALSRLGNGLPCQTVVGVTPSGQGAVAVGVDGVVRIFDLQTYAEVRTLAEPTPHVQGLAFDPQGDAVVLVSGHPHDAGQPGRVRSFSLQTGQRLRESPLEAGGRSVIRHPDGRWFVGLSTGAIAIFDRQLNPTGKLLEQHQGAVHGLAVSADGRQLASASWDQTVKLWDPDTGELRETLTGHFDVVSAVSFSPDGARLASCSGNPYATSSSVVTGGAVKIWDVGIGQEVWNTPGWEVARWLTIRRPHGVTTALIQPTWTYASDVAFSPDGTRLAAAFRDGTLRLWLGMPGPGSHNR